MLKDKNKKIFNLKKKFGKKLESAQATPSNSRSRSWDHDNLKKKANKIMEINSQWIKYLRLWLKKEGSVKKMIYKKKDRCQPKLTF
jgi:hypothetical protein